MGRQEEAYDLKTAYGGADHRGVEGRPGRHQRAGSVPEARHLGRDVLQVAGQVCGPRRQRREEAASARRGEPAAEADGGRAGPGHPGAQGAHRNKRVGPRRSGWRPSVWPSALG